MSVVSIGAVVFAEEVSPWEVTRCRLDPNLRCRAVSIGCFIRPLPCVPVAPSPHQIGVTLVGYEAYREEMKGGLGVELGAADVSPWLAVPVQEPS